MTNFAVIFTIDGLPIKSLQQLKGRVYTVIAFFVFLANLKFSKQLLKTAIWFPFSLKYFSV